jgi:hypothetical protein
MNDYQFDAIYKEMKAQTKLLTAISRANRFAAFSGEELETISEGLSAMYGGLALAYIDDPLAKEIEAELARRKAERNKPPGYDS